jgi:DNA-binding LytR/AlgR family response regulator
LEEKKIQLNEILKYKNKHVEAGMVHFLDEKKVLRLSLRIDDLLYVQSADNYVYIYYTNNKNDIVKFLLRNTLKSVEEAFSSIGLIRCHRFYVVNSKKVSLLRKTKEGLVLELATDTACEIPVSKTYLSKVADFFTS